MSNCIDLRNATVVFTADDIDLPALGKLIADSKDSDKDDFKNPVPYLVAWFVKGATVLTDTTATITFGTGDSSHTFRDFGGTINAVLKPLMKRSKKHVFTVRDAENPQEGWFRWPVDFQAGITR